MSTSLYVNGMETQEVCVCEGSFMNRVVILAMVLSP